MTEDALGDNLKVDVRDGPGDRITHTPVWNGQLSNVSCARF